MTDFPIFKPGDTVRLKSGGPLMTIDYEFTGAGAVFGEAIPPVGTRTYYARWFDGSTENHMPFANYLLVAADPKTEPSEGRS